MKEKQQDRDEEISNSRTRKIKKQRTAVFVKKVYNLLKV